jgi:hypothetical protein
VSGGSGTAPSSCSDTTGTYSTGTAECTG